MSNYYLGVDFGRGDDETCYTIIKRPSRLRKWLRRTGLDRSRWGHKIIYSGNNPSEVRKRRFKSAIVEEWRNDLVATGLHNDEVKRLMPVQTPDEKFKEIDYYWRFGDDSKALDVEQYAKDRLKALKEKNPNE